MREFTTFQTLLKPLTTRLITTATERFNSDYRCKHFKTRDHLMTLIYAQIHDLKSLRDLEIAWNSQTKYLSCLECQPINRSTLSDANHHRSSACFLWILKQLLCVLPSKKRQEIHRIIRKLDSSPIQLKGKGFDEWTLLNRTQRCQGLKLHTEYDSEIAAPVRIEISYANVDDCSMSQRWPILADTIYVFDKGYYDFNWWWKLNCQKAFFVTRLKKNAAIEIIEERVAEGENILEDSLFRFKNMRPRGGKKNLYTKPLRRVVVKREEGKKPLVFVTNLLDTSAEVISTLYKERWDIELFFKWIKQNLRIKKFLGKSKNAVTTQIASALIAYILISIFKLSFKNNLSLHQMLIWIQHNATVDRSPHRIKPPPYHFERDRTGLKFLRC